MSINVITENRASGAQIVDGSLKFSPTANGSGGTRLERTPSVSGNRRTWTWSAWVKRGEFFTGTNETHLFDSRVNDDDRFYGIAIAGPNDGNFLFIWEEYSSGNYYYHKSTPSLRDTGWYHLVVAVDTTRKTGSDRVKFYANGQLLETAAENGSYPFYPENFETNVNQASSKHFIGSFNDARNFDGLITQNYLIDGLALAPGYFGFTDSLTGTWRPKKFRAEGTTVNDGTQWSSTIGSFTNGANVFNGDTTNQGYANSTGTTTLTTGKFVIENNLRLYNNFRSDGTYNIIINGVSINVPGEGTNSSNYRVSEVDLSSLQLPITVTSLQYNISQTSGNSIRAIEVDGVIMQDSTTTNLDFGTNGFYFPFDGNSPIGLDRSNAGAINDGTVWSSGAGANFESGNPATNGFDGSSSTYTRTDNANVTATVTLPSSISFTTLQVRGARDSGNGTIAVNGIDVSSQFTSSSATLETVTITGVTSPLRSIALTGISGSAQPRFAQIIVDGVVLTDGVGYTPVNFGGSAEINKATGATPILNTNQGGTQAGVGVRPVSEGFPNTVINDGTVWSDSTESMTGYQGPKGIFDGGLGTDNRGGFSSTNTSQYYTLFDRNGVNLNVSVTKIRIYWNGVDSGQRSVRINDSTEVNGGSGALTPGWDTYTYSGTLHKLEVKTAATSSWGISAVEINGVILIDGLGLVLALPLVGSATDVSNQINSSSTAKTITVNGGAVASSLESNFYDGSFLFDGSGDYLNTSSSSDFSMGTGDFTVECWVYQTSASSAEDGVFQISTGSSGLNGSNSNTITLQTNSGTYRMYANDTSTAMSTAVITDRWVHLAVVRNSGTTKLYVNGIQDATIIPDTRDYSGTYVAIGGYYSSSYLWVGNIQDFRIYKGVAKYTSNFIPAATNPDIIPDTPSGITGQTNLAKITGGAVNFNGSSDYLTAGQSEDYNFGTGSWTIECFAYFNNNTSSQDITDFTNNSSGSGDPGGQLYFSSSASNGLMWYQSSTQYAKTTTAPIIPKKWLHIAVVKNSSGDTIKIYIDGKEEGSSSHSESAGTNAGALRIGLQGSTYFNGFLSNLRVIKGTALYTANFTPPTRELTNVTNTKLLTCQTPTHISAAVAPLVSGVNNGTVWSSSITSGSAFRSGYPAIDAFNGNTKTSTNDCTAIDTTQFAFFEFTFGGGIPFTTLQLQCDDNNEGTVVVNGVDITSQLPTGSLTNTTITGVSSPLTSLRCTKTVSGSSSVYFGSITIDGTMLADPLTVNGDAAATNFNPFITDINAVRGQETGYATLNPLNNVTEATFADGNLKVTTKNASSHYGTHTSTLPMSSGKHYAEVTVESTQGYPTFGVCDVTSTFTDTSWIGSLNPAISYYGDNGKKYVNGASAATYGSSFGAGNTIGIAVDLDNLTVEFFKDGVSQGVITGLTDNTEYFFGGSEFDTGSGVFLWNYGQKPFKFPPPDGFQSLNLASTRPDTVIARSDKFVGVQLYTGNAGVNTISGYQFAPDFLWLKSRGSNQSHGLFDRVRGSGNRLQSNTTDDQDDYSSYFTGFTNDGFTLNNNSGINQNTDTLVAWAWKAGGNRGVFNVDGAGFASAGDIGFDAGGQNNNAYNRDQTWSNFIEGNIDSSYGSATDLFNGTIPTGTADSVRSTNPGYLILNLSTLNITATTVKLYTYIYATPRTFQVNGVTIDRSQVSGNQDKEFTIPVNGKLNSIAWSYDSGSGPYCYMRAIEVDGKLLVNNGVSPTNVPSIAATGASVGTKQGFSIVKYTGNASSSGGTIPHGLSQKPEFLIFKDLDGSDLWHIHHKDLSLSNTVSGYKYLTFTTAGEDNPVLSGITDVSNSAVTFGSQRTELNGANSFISYMWHSVPGLQKFGKYTGNGSSNGPIIELGFRPAVILYKRIDSTGYWRIMDNQRDPVNVAYRSLFPNTSDSESTTAGSSQYDIDMLSNGFKIRTDLATSNADGGTFIYGAWAEAPSVNLFGGQSNGR